MLDIRNIQNPQRTCDDTPSPLKAHSGFTVQSAFGQHGNFEMVVPEGERLAHYWRDNDAPGVPWHRDVNDVIAAPSLAAVTKNALKAAAMLQSNFGGNFEAVVWLHPENSRETTLGGGAANPADYLSYNYLDRFTLKWSPPREIIADGNAVAEVTGPQ